MTQRPTCRRVSAVCKVSLSGVAWGRVRERCLPCGTPYAQCVRIKLGPKPPV
ncbi:hypothetical protein BDV18DRAFT_136471 [Aspergillus unguis]